jgi:hypothetical protein
VPPRRALSVLIAQEPTPDHAGRILTPRCLSRAALSEKEAPTCPLFENRPQSIPAHSPPVLRQDWPKLSGKDLPRLLLEHLLRATANKYTRVGTRGRRAKAHHPCSRAYLVNRAGCRRFGHHRTWRHRYVAVLLSCAIADQPTIRSASDKWRKLVCLRPRQQAAAVSVLAIDRWPGRMRVMFPVLRQVLSRSFRVTERKIS